MWLQISGVWAACGRRVVAWVRGAGNRRRPSKTAVVDRRQSMT
ncbi:MULTISPECIES: hypothetical protein [Corynebacterium]|nr:MULTISPECIES: hypothetical protein [Corynebacterium]MDU3197094.1 hypothetical protein [Corynebacterium kroppenstedtii]UWY21697.1 hypothetical protein N2K96_08695 [Corynebacterium kroppenstedtii]